MENVLPCLVIVLAVFGAAYTYSSFESNIWDVPTAMKYATGASACACLGYIVMFWPGAAMGLFVGLCVVVLWFQFMEPMCRSLLDALGKDVSGR